MKCEKCKTILAENIKFCPECGTPAPKPIAIPKVQEKKELPPILTMDQAAEFLGISRCQLYIVIRTQGVPWFPVGSSKRFLAEELINWAKSKQVFGEAV